MSPDQKEFDPKQGPPGIPAIVWLVIGGLAMALLVAILMVIFWPRPIPPRPVTRNAPAVGPPPRFEPMIERRQGPPRIVGGPGSRFSQPAYEGTNLGNWFDDLKSADPATVQRAREALAALGVEVPGTAPPTGEKTNSPPTVNRTTPPPGSEDPARSPK